MHASPHIRSAFSCAASIPLHSPRGGRDTYCVQVGHRLDISIHSPRGGERPNNRSTNSGDIALTLSRAKENITSSAAFYRTLRNIMMLVLIAVLRKLRTVFIPDEMRPHLISAFFR